MQKLVVSVVPALSRGFLVSNHALKNRKARSNGLNMADLRERNMEEDKTDSML